MATDTLDSVILEIENDRLDRRVELIEKARAIYTSHAQVAEDLNKLMKERIDPSVIHGTGGVSSHAEDTSRTISEDRVKNSDFKYGLTTFMMNKISEVFKDNRFNNIEKTTKKSFIDIFETLKDLLVENKGNSDYANFVNDVLFIYFT